LSDNFNNSKNITSKELSQYSVMYIYALIFYINVTKTRCVTFVKIAVSVGAQGLCAFHNQLCENFAYCILYTAIISRIYHVRIFVIVYFPASILNCRTILTSIFCLFFELFDNSKYS